MGAIAEFLIASLAIVAAFGGWILAYKMWKRDPDAVKRAADELVRARKELETETKSLEAMIHGLKTDLLLGPLLTEDDRSLRTLAVETVIEDAFRRILQRVEDSRR
ncbi:MAG: hypothetical protein WCV58_02640 [Patescibacteria group bacterium]